jgi:hypothetical protein
LRKHRSNGSCAALLSPLLRQATLEYEWPGQLAGTRKHDAPAGDPGPDELARQLLSASAHRANADVIRFQPAGAVSSIAFPVLEKVNEAKRKAETEAILNALDASRWNRKQAAKILRLAAEVEGLSAPPIEHSEPTDQRRGGSLDDPQPDAASRRAREDIDLLMTNRGTGRQGPPPLPIPGFDRVALHALAAAEPLHNHSTVEGHRLRSRDFKRGRG